MQEKKNFIKFSQYSFKHFFLIFIICGKYPEYLSNLDNSLPKIPESAHVWLGKDSNNLGDIDWGHINVTPSTGEPKYGQQLLDTAKDRFLEHQVYGPTRITDHSSITFDLFFTNNSSLVS